MTDRIRLDGRVAVVTGAAGVIGPDHAAVGRARRAYCRSRPQAQELQAAIAICRIRSRRLHSPRVTDEAEVADYVRAAVGQVRQHRRGFNNMPASEAR